MINLNCIVNFLHKKNYKVFYLAFLRIAICIFLLSTILMNWSSMDTLYSRSSFVTHDPNLFSKLPSGTFQFIQQYYLIFILTYILVILLNFTGIGKGFTMLLLFLMFDVNQKMTVPFVIGGDKMIGNIILFLIFADSYEYFSLHRQHSIRNRKRQLKDLLSNLAAFSIMLQLCFAYFSSAVAKLSDPIWLNGEAVYYALQIERFMGTPYNKWIAQHRLLVVFASYLVLLIELLFPFLIWIKKLRLTFLIAGFLLHASLYIFLMIYGFQIVFVLIYGLFLPNDLLLKYAHKINSFFGGKQGALTRYIGLANNTNQI